MRVLMYGHATHGGFGTVTFALGERFIAQGVDLRVLAVDHRGAPIKGPLGSRMWPAEILQGGSHGGNTSGAAIDGTLWRRLDPNDDWKPDVVLVVSDMSGLLATIGTFAEQWATLPVFHYCPIEGDNLPQSWAPVWRFLYPVAMSDYGARVMGAHSNIEVPRIYHGVDTDTFRPVSIANPISFDGKSLATKEACKAAFGIDPRRTVILRYDRLVLRKFYDRFITAIIPILEQAPDAEVVIHCAPIDENLNLFDELARVPEAVKDRVRLTGKHDTYTGLPIEGLVALVNAADIYMTTTGGEGFGLTSAEALACGVPVVSSDWAAEREVVGPGGVMVPPLHDRYGEPVRYHSVYGMDWAVPDPKGFVEPVLELINRPARRRAMGVEGRAHVKRSFSWDVAATQFIDLFQEALNAPVAVAV